jgi:hypothetical protein
MVVITADISVYEVAVGRRIIMKSSILLILMLCISLPVQARDLTKEERILILENMVIQLTAAVAANNGAIAVATDAIVVATDAVAAATHDRYTDLEAMATIGPHFSGNHGDLVGVNSGQHHTSQVANVMAIQALLAGVSREQFDPITGVDTLTFTNMNIQLVSGSGDTDGWVNGAGNLIIGYNETGNFFGDDKSGSHMLVIGKANNYSSYGGMVLGLGNETSGAYSSVSGGQRNIASGFASSVSSGAVNVASASYSSVSGGMENLASEFASSVSGGILNAAIDDYSSVSGGLDGIASGKYDWVAGGLFQDD